jgi:hypothetical protein
MADRDLRADREVAAALDALALAYDKAASAIETAPDTHRAFERATQLAETLRDAAESAAELRARVAANIWETEALSLAQLAKRIGVSKARAAQLVRTARAAAVEEGSADA